MTGPGNSSLLKRVKDLIVDRLATVQDLTINGILTLAGSISLPVGSIDGSAITNGTLDLATKVSGQLPDANIASGITASKVSGALSNATLDGSKLVAASVSDDRLATSYLKADGSRALTGNLSTGGNEITGLPNTPSGTSSAVSKSYVDAVAQGLSTKSPAACATTANITLSGEQTIDGVTTSTSRVLVKNQTDQTQNGIYVSASGAWTRATDADAGSELVNAFVFVTGGTVNQKTGWVQQTAGPITIGTSNIVWVQFSAAGVYTGGVGIALTGAEFDFIPDNTTMEAAGGAGSAIRIKDLGVSTGKIADLAVTTGKLADGAATTAKLASQAVTSAKISPGAVRGDMTYLFGDGRDGAKTGNPSWLVTDGIADATNKCVLVQYTDWTIGNNVSVSPQGTGNVQRVIVFVSGTLTIGNNVTISMNGQMANGGAAGSAGGAGYFRGGTGGDGVSSGAVANALSVTQVQMAQILDILGQNTFLRDLIDINALAFGGGGGGGGTGVGNSGGAGGAGGGVILIFANNISIGTGCVISANGVNGSRGGGSCTNGTQKSGGGGGGGSGGVAILAYKNNVGSNLPTATATKGTGAAGWSSQFDPGSGLTCAGSTAGADGTDGLARILQLV